MTELCDLKAIEARRHIGTKEISPVELLESCIARTDAINPAVNSIVTTCYERARREAKIAEEDVLSGKPLGLLHGLPFGAKDLESTGDIRTTMGSQLYANNIPDTDQRSIANIRGNGGILIGKTNTPEFGAGANTRNLVFGATGNPFNPELSCAGSSGGSAVSLATGMVPLATGSDYGGSLRTPASFCGVVGFRPSPGVVPNELRSVALNPFSVLGPMGRTVGDAALLLSAMIGDDPRDPFGCGIDPELLEPIQPTDISRYRIAISEDLGVAPLDDDIRQCFKKKVKGIQHIFFSAQQQDPPFNNDLHQAFEVLRCVNYLSAHAEKLEKHRDLLTPNVIANIEMASQFTMTDVAWAHQKQTALYRGYTQMFNEIDLLLSPAAAVSPFPHAEWYPKEINGQKLPNYMRWMAPSYALTMATPASCVLPFGVDSKGFPMGLQISAPNGSDHKILACAAAIESVLESTPETARPLPNLETLREGA